MRINDLIVQRTQDLIERELNYQASMFILFFIINGFLLILLINPVLKNILIV